MAQGTHTNWPVTLVYVPAAQLTHDSEPVAAANWPTAQPMQLVDTDAPVVAR